jgi:hypothetical protein
MVVESNAYQRIQTLVELHADGIVSVKRSRDADQNLREIREDSPVTIFVGVGQCGAGDFAAEASMVELAAQRSEARLDITKVNCAKAIARN